MCLGNTDLCRVRAEDAQACGGGQAEAAALDGPKARALADSPEANACADSRLHSEACALAGFTLCIFRSHVYSLHMFNNIYITYVGLSRKELCAIEEGFHPYTPTTAPKMLLPAKAPVFECARVKAFMSCGGLAQVAPMCRRSSMDAEPAVATLPLPNHPEVEDTRAMWPVGAMLPACVACSRCAT